MFPLTSTETGNNANLVSSAEKRAILVEQMQIHYLCKGKPSLREFLSFQGWLPPNNTDFLNEQWLIGLKQNKQERIRLEWRNALAVARLKSIVK